MDKAAVEHMHETMQSAGRLADRASCPRMENEMRCTRSRVVGPTKITCHIGAFCFDACQFGAFHFGDFHFDAVPVRRVSLWRASTSARFSLARFPILYLS